MIRRLPRWAWALLAVVVVVAAAVLVGPRERMALVGFVGRFHPALVHLPIGALVAAAVLVGLARSGRHAVARSAIVPVLGVAAFGAVAAVAAGQALSAEGGYGGDTFLWHQRLGYVVAALAAAAALSAWRASRRGDVRLQAASDVLVAAGVVLLGLVGHLGGTLTHGEGYLTERLPAPFARWFGAESALVQARSVQPAQVVVYDALVKPVLQEHCVDCHGPSKANGDLRLDTPDTILAGGRTGAVLVAGQANASDLIRRLWLPPVHKDAMPPKSSAPMPAADASVLRWWVDAGASFTHTLADVEIAPEVMPAIQVRVGNLSLDGPALLAVEAGPLDDATLDRLAASGLPVSRLAEGVDWLQVEARGSGVAFDDAALEALVPLALHITWMDLGGTAITDEGVALLARFPHLTRLHLDRTAVTDARLDAVAGLQHLSSVNVYGTRVTDAGLEHLASARSLQAVYAGNTGVTAEGVAATAVSRPDLTVHANVTATAATPPASAPARPPAPSR